MTQRLEAPLHERVLVEEIHRRIAADGHFGKDDEVGFSPSRLSGELHYLLRVALEVANHGIDLSNGHFHGRPS